MNALNNSLSTIIQVYNARNTFLAVSSVLAFQTITFRLAISNEVCKGGFSYLLPQLMNIPRDTQAYLGN
jgi:hypothetical protein